MMLLNNGVGLDPKKKDKSNKNLGVKLGVGVNLKKLKTKSNIPLLSIVLT